MGREIRRVPANYQHPTYEFANSLTQRMETRKQPMFDRAQKYCGQKDLVSSATTAGYQGQA